jgi:ABC-type sugar transport system substrate-binding protein
VSLSAAVVSACLALSACSSSGSGGTGGGAGASGSAPRIGVDFPFDNSDFWNAYDKYIPQYGKTLGLKLKTTDSQNDISKLADNVQTLVAQGAKGVVIAPQDTPRTFPSSQWILGPTAARSTWSCVPTTRPTATSPATTSVTR